MVKDGLWLGVVAVGFAVAGLIPACDASAPPSTDHLQEIDALAAAEFAKDSVGSLTIGAIAPSRELWTKSYGFADGEKTIPATQDTIYRIGSITKQFTALMLLQLVERGKVHLLDPVEKYFPEVDRIQGRFPSAPPITLVQLATHTAGLAVEPDELQKYMVGPVSQWESILLTALPHTRYVHEPGTRWSYSNIGYAILGRRSGPGRKAAVYAVCPGEHFPTPRHDPHGLRADGRDEAASRRGPSSRQRSC